MKGEWLDIQGYEGQYQINIKGEVRSLKRLNEYDEPHILAVSKYGRREVVYLHCQRESKRHSVKGLVWRHFGIR